MPVRIVTRNKDGSKRIKSLFNASNGKRATPVVTEGQQERTGPSEVTRAPDKLKVLGDFRVLPVFDPEEVKGRSIFLVHRWAYQRWYKIRSYDDTSGDLKLLSKHGTEFESKVTIVTPQQYRTVIGPEAAKEVPFEVMSYVQQAHHGQVS